MRTFENSFERNPKIAGGQPVLRGTRVPLRTVLVSLAEGSSFEEILKNFPTLTPEHLRAAVAFAASRSAALFSDVQTAKRMSVAPRRLASSCASQVHPELPSAAREGASRVSERAFRKEPRR